MLANTRCSLRLGCQLCWDHRVVCAIAPPSLARGSVPSAAAGERALPRPRLLLRLARASARAGTISGEGRDRCSSTEGAVWAARRDTRSLRVGRGPAARKAQLPAADCGVQRRGELWIGIIGGARRGRSMISTFSVPASIAPLDNRALASRPSPILLWSHRESRAASNAPARSRSAVRHLGAPRSRPVFRSGADQPRVSPGARSERRMPHGDDNRDTPSPTFRDLRGGGRAATTPAFGRSGRPRRRVRERRVGRTTEAPLGPTRCIRCIGTTSAARELPDRTALDDRRYRNEACKEQRRRGSADTRSDPPDLGESQPLLTQIVGP
jgi:hypothetical protein